jgi:methionine biosynthesis protein MetW
MSKQHNIRAYGLEIDQEKIAIAISRGLNIIQQDLNLGLSRFADQSFDSVVMAQALQAVDAPDVLLRDMVRVGKQAIITFPNFAYWKTRSFLALNGITPRIFIYVLSVTLKPYVLRTELKLLIDLPLMVTNKVVCSVSICRTYLVKSQFIE